MWTTLEIYTNIIVDAPEKTIKTDAQGGGPNYKTIIIKIDGSIKMIFLIPLPVQVTFIGHNLIN